MYKRRQLSALYKLLRFYWTLMDMCLPKFDTYQGAVALNCFKSHVNSWCPDFFQKKVLSDVRYKIRLVRRNIGHIYSETYIFRPDFLVDTGRQLNVHKTNSLPVPTGLVLMLRFQLSYSQLKNGTTVLKGFHFSENLSQSQSVENVQNLQWFSHMTIS